VRQDAVTRDRRYGPLTAKRSEGRKEGYHTINVTLTTTFDARRPSNGRRIESRIVVGVTVALARTEVRQRELLSRAFSRLLQEKVGRHLQTIAGCSFRSGRLPALSACRQTRRDRIGEVPTRRPPARMHARLRCFCSGEMAPHAVSVHRPPKTVVTTANRLQFDRGTTIRRPTLRP